MVSPNCSGQNRAERSQASRETGMDAAAALLDAPLAPDAVGTPDNGAIN